MPLYDFHCDSCDTTFEALTQSNAVAIACHQEGCNGSAVKLMPAPHSFNVIQATHNKSKFLKAGGIHLKRPKTPGKIQVGYTGK